MNLVDTASKIAKEAHAGQYRKYVTYQDGSKVPYLVHPDRVRMHLYALGLSETTLAAGQLHDVFEDCDLRFRDMVADQCGEEVYVLVHSVTNPSKGLKGSRSLRKMIDRAYLRDVPGEAVKIKLADRTDNLRDMLKGAPEDFKRLYLNESALLFEVLARRTDLGDGFSTKQLFSDYDKAFKELDMSIPK